MELHIIDIIIIFAYIVATIGIGFWISKRASKKISMRASNLEIMRNSRTKQKIKKKNLRRRQIPNLIPMLNTSQPKKPKIQPIHISRRYNEDTMNTKLYLQETMNVMDNASY